MVQIARIIGGAGTGKTTHLLTLMDKVLERREADPYSIGFVSFTRAARREASTRAAESFGLKPEDLERNGWFRTLHSICYRQLNIGKELITGNADDRRWIQEKIGHEVSGCSGDEEGTDLSGRQPAASAGDHSLAVWDKARSTLKTVEEVYRETDRVVAINAMDWPDLDLCKEIIQSYERNKTLDHRCDFTDLLGRFAGIEFGTDGHIEVEPCGDVPEVPVWFLDEQQDTSALLDRVCRRLVEGSKFAYLSLDPFQAIYGFAGSDSRHAMAWKIQEGKHRVLGQSYRCPERVLALGESILKDCSDYWDRKIQPRKPGGVIDVGVFEEGPAGWTSEIDPRESWLLVARTNFHAQRIAKKLQRDGIPWVPTTGNGGWKPCARLKAIHALYMLSMGYGCDALGWRDVLKTLPSKVGETEFIVRGTKARWGERENDWEETADQNALGQWGATDELIQHLRSGRWKNLIRGSESYVSAVERWGPEGTLNPKVRVGTVHSVKGSEADNVAILTTTSSRVETAKETDEGADEERRIAYVAVTRARERVLILEERSSYRMEIPA